MIKALPNRRLYHLRKRVQGKVEREFMLYGCELSEYLGDVHAEDQIHCVSADGMELLLSGEEVLIPNHLLICEVEGEMQIIPALDSVGSRWLKQLVHLEVRRNGE